MAAFNRFDGFLQALATGQHNLGTDALKVALSNTAPSPSHSTLSQIVELSAGNGYTAGGNLAAVVASEATPTGGYALTLADVSFTATGGALPTFQYCVLYNSTNSKLIGWWQADAPVDIADGESFLIDYDQTSALFTLS